MIAGPGTGKTTTIVNEVLKLVDSGVPGKDIACTTFTNKAADEMLSRLRRQTGNEPNRKSQIHDVSVGTIHSHIMASINSESEEADLIRPELMRLIIYRVFKSLGTFSYPENYLTGTLIPGAENAMRYVKSYGILPGDIDEGKTAEVLLKDHNLNSRATIGQMKRLLHDFILSYAEYEKFKLQREGRMDYNDILIRGSSMKTSRVPYLFVDELQDLSRLQIKVIENIGERLFCVGDRKQSIFGFQGGSISSFREYINDARFRKVSLTIHRRCTPEILHFSSEYLISMTSDRSLQEEVRKLESTREHGKKPRVILTNSSIDLVASMVRKLVDSGYGGTIGIIARRNIEVFRISRVLDQMGIQHTSSEPVSLSSTPSSEIIAYLRGIALADPLSISSAILTPFFGLTLEKASTINSKIRKGEFTMEDLPDNLTKELMNGNDGINILIRAFDRIIIPISVSLGGEYYATALKLKELTDEYAQNLDSISFSEYFTFLDLSPIESDYEAPEGKINVLTVHKAKGKEFDTVFYLPSTDRRNSSYFDRVATAIIRATIGVNVGEDLAEEPMRIDYVAMTRAKDSLTIVAENSKLVERYRLGDELVDFIEEDSPPVFLNTPDTRIKDAYSMFINRQDQEAVKLRDSNENGWIREKIRSYFSSISSVSFSLLSDIDSPLSFLKAKILGLHPASRAAMAGVDFHSLASSYSDGDFPDGIPPDMVAMKENYKAVLERISAMGFDVPPRKTELKVSSTLEDLDPRYNGIDLEVKGYIDAIFTTTDLRRTLVVDYKTGGSESGTPRYFLQLTLYSLLYSASSGIAVDNLTMGLAYVNLRPGINENEEFHLMKFITRPASKGRKEDLFGLLDRFIRYRGDPELFVSDAIAEIEESIQKNPETDSIDRRILSDLSS